MTKKRFAMVGLALILALATSLVGVRDSSLSVGIGQYQYEITIGSQVLATT